MRAYKVRLKDVRNNGASATSVVEIPAIGRRLLGLVIQQAYSGGTNSVAGALANLNFARLFVDGSKQREISGTELRDLLLFNGTAYDADTGVPNTAPGTGIIFPFAEPWRKDVNAYYQGALPLEWDGGSFKRVHLELAAGASAPTFIVHAVYDDELVKLPSWMGGVPWFTKWERLTIPASGTSFDYTSLNKRDVMLQLSLYKDSGGSQAATKVTFTKNGRTLEEFTSSVNSLWNTAHNTTPAASGRTAGIFDVVRDISDTLRAGEPLGDAKETVLTVEAASAMSSNITGILQLFGPPNVG